MRIDSHQHFWKFDPVRDSWINEEMKIIQRDFFPENLKPILSQNKIEGCVSVQADQSETETNFLLNHANEHDFIKGVVGWVDLRSNDLLKRLEYFSQFQKLKGFRHIVQAEPIGFLRGDQFSKGINALKDFNFTYDILIYPNQLEDALWLVNEHLNQKFVVDHLAKPTIKNKEIEKWSTLMKELSLCSNVWCKLSGMVTEADWKSWNKKDFAPYLEVVINSFGANRVMYGSDWPVCLVAARYEEQLGIVESFIESFSDTEKQLIMGENAITFYNL
ncbi:MAG: amidohydrolase family protein [Cyclobacteriaceae bacterium]|nr:amidohydrolase family protein [Cyclobacteriaceae bacterium]